MHGKTFILLTTLGILLTGCKGAEQCRPPTGRAALAAEVKVSEPEERLHPEALFEAANRGDVDAVERILAVHPELADLTDEFGLRALDKVRVVQMQRSGQDKHKIETLLHTHQSLDSLEEE